MSLIHLLPDADSIYLLPFLVAWTHVSARAAGYARGREIGVPYTRKIFHFLIISAAGFVHFTGGTPAVSLFGCIVGLFVFHCLLRGEGHPLFEAIARETDAPHRGLYVIIPFAATAAGGILSNLLFGSAAVIGYLVTGWGDAVAEPVGTRWGAHRYRVKTLTGMECTRSLEGSAAVLLASLAASYIGFSLLGDTSPAAHAAAVAVVAAVVEAVSSHGLDNLTLQIASSGVAWYLLSNGGY